MSYSPRTSKSDKLRSHHVKLKSGKMKEKDKPKEYSSQKVSEEEILITKQMAKSIKDHIRITNGPVGMVYTAQEILLVLDRVKRILKNQENLIRAKAPIKVVGDLHGQFSDLRRLFRANGRPPRVKYIFLGDYVDRGKHSLECIMLLFLYKALYPNSIVLLRGNHECLTVNKVYGFYDELVRRDMVELHSEFNRVFDYLPIAAIVNNRILCMHGGISKHITDLDQIKRMERPYSVNTNIPGIDSSEIATDLLWADPDREISGYEPSARNISFHFGMDALEDFCKKTKIEFVVRGHQVVERGFERMGSTNRTRIVTVFSAPNYCNEFDNSAAVMIIDEKLGITFNVLEPSANAFHKAERTTDRANTPKFDVYPVEKSDAMA